MMGSLENESGGGSQKIIVLRGIVDLLPRLKSWDSSVGNLTSRLPRL